MKYKSDSKKYCKSEVQKYKNISNKQSERADLVEMCPDFDFFMFFDNFFKCPFTNVSTWKVSNSHKCTYQESVKHSLP